MAAYIRGKQCYCQGGKVRYSDEHQFCPRCEMLAEYDATRPQPGIPPEGESVLVPREPTYDMLRKAESDPECQIDCTPGEIAIWPTQDEARSIYKAMLAAAPSPAVAQCAPQGEAVRALVEKWRTLAANLDPSVTEQAKIFLRYCADELEAALGRELAGQGREATSASPATPPG